MAGAQYCNWSNMVTGEARDGGDGSPLNGQMMEVVNEGVV